VPAAAVFVVLLGMWFISTHDVHPGGILWIFGGVYGSSVNVHEAGEFAVACRDKVDHVGQSVLSSTMLPPGKSQQLRHKLAAALLFYFWWRLFSARLATLIALVRASYLYIGVRVYCEAMPSESNIALPFFCYQTHIGHVERRCTQLSQKMLRVVGNASTIANKAGKLPSL
jgi:hypothetical protein